MGDWWWERVNANVKKWVCSWPALTDCTHMPKRLFAGCPLRLALAALQAVPGVGNFAIGWHLSRRAGKGPVANSVASPPFGFASPGNFWVSRFRFLLICALSTENVVPGRRYADKCCHVALFAWDKFLLLRATSWRWGNDGIANHERKKRHNYRDPIESCFFPWIWFR